MVISYIYKNYLNQALFTFMSISMSVFINIFIKVFLILKGKKIFLFWIIFRPIKKKIERTKETLVASYILHIYLRSGIPIVSSPSSQENPFATESFQYSSSSSNPPLLDITVLYTKQNILL